MDLLLVGGIALAGTVGFLVYFFLGSFVYGAGFEPTPPATVRRMLDLAEVGPADTLVDLGAGTGAIVFRAVQDRGARAIAVEREPLRYAILRWRRRRSAHRELVEVSRQDLFAAPLGSATVVALFLWPGAMERLRPYLERNLRPGARVVSHYHPVRGWQPLRTDRSRQVFLYRVPQSFSRSVTGDGR